MSTEQMAAQQQANAEAEARYQASIPTCSSDKECQAKWSAARRYVLDHCDYKLQHVTDDFMETFNSGDMAATQMWCRVTKSPINDTTYRIELEAGRNNPFSGGTQAVRWQFNEFVNAAWQQ